MKKLFYLIVLPSLFACKSAPKSDLTEDRIVNVASSDSTMNKAIAEAQKTVPQFVEAFNKNDSSCVDFSVKYPFEDNKGSYEHIWLNELEIKNGEITGTVANEPELTTKVKFGERVTVSMNEISDWMYVKKDELIGGYTIRVLRDMMSKEERTAFDQSLPYKIN